MTHQNDYTLPQDLAEKGLETVPELLRVLINQAMQAGTGEVPQRRSVRAYRRADRACQWLQAQDSPGQGR